MRLNQVPEVLTKLFHTGQTVELQGGPGIGKSDMVASVARRLESQLGEPVGFIPTILSQLDAVDVRGFLIPREDEDGALPSRFTTPPIFPQRHQFPNGEIPRYGIVFLDERRQADHSVQKTIGQLLLERRIGDYHLDAFGHWVVWSASNRMTDKSGTFRDLAFLTNRILFIDIEPDLNSWVDWAVQHKVHPMFVAYAQTFPHNVFRDTVPDTEGPFCTPRTLTMASRVAQDDCMGFNHPLLTETLKGLIGEGTAAELMTFARVAEVVPSIERIVKAPKQAKLPPAERPDAQYYVMNLCVYHINEGNSGAIFEYLMRLPAEFQVAAVVNALKACPAVAQNPKIGEWVKENKDLIRTALATS